MSERSSVQGWLARALAAARARWVAFDEQLASDALRRFEARLPEPESGARALPVRADAVARRIASAGRPVVEHHWASWCEPCIEELPRVAELARRVAASAEVVLVSWDAFDSHGPDTAVAAAAAMARRFSVQAPSWVVLDAPEVVFAVLDPPARTVPCTRVLDADGGVLRAYAGPLSAADVEDIVALLGS